MEKLPCKEERCTQFFFEVPLFPEAEQMISFILELSTSCGYLLLNQIISTYSDKKILFVLSPLFVALWYAFPGVLENACRNLFRSEKVVVSF